MWRDSQSPPEGQPERRKRRARYLKARQEQRSLAVAQAHYGGMLDDISTESLIVQRVKTSEDVCAWLLTLRQIHNAEIALAELLEEA
jgi:hypothetical protein